MTPSANLRSQLFKAYDHVYLENTLNWSAEEAPEGKRQYGTEQRMLGRINPWMSKGWTSKYSTNKVDSDK